MYREPLWLPATHTHVSLYIDDASKKKKNGKSRTIKLKFVIVHLGILYGTLWQDSARGVKW